MSTTTSMIPANDSKYFAQRFALWLGMVSMFMVFAGWTSAYIVRRAQSDWLQFDLPNQFYASTVVLLISSITMIGANHYYKNDQFSKFKFFLQATLVLGIVFAVLQYFGWKEMQSRGIFLGYEDSNPSGSFVYLISGAHWFHVLFGILLLLVAYIRATIIFKDPIRGLIKDLSPQKGIRMDLLSTYWHFVDILWVYLLLFLIINK